MREYVESCYIGIAWIWDENSQLKSNPHQSKIFSSILEFQIPSFIKLHKNSSEILDKKYSFIKI